MICQCGAKGCGCSPRCPDYLAMAIAAGETPSPRRRKQLEMTNEQLRVALRWWPASAVRHDACAYCDRPFWSMRSHSETCSTACRASRSTAQRMQRHEVPHALSDERRETWSAERQRATGDGFMSRHDAWAADMRCARPDED